MSIRESIQRAQKAYKEKLVVLAAERERLTSDSYPLFMAFVSRRLPRAIMDMLGGRDATIADLGLAYIKSVRAWFTSRRRRKLSTYVYKGCLWGAYDLIRERHVVKYPDERDATKMTSARLIAFAKQAQKQRHFHGAEGRCEDDVLLCQSSAYESAVKNEEKATIHKALRSIEDRRRLVLEMRSMEMTFTKIGEFFCVSKSMIGILHASALEKIRKAINLKFPGLAKDYAH